MATEIITALIALSGSAMGTLGGIILNSRLTNYRIAQLEKKVDEHNNLIARTYELEGRVSVLDEKMKDSNHRIEDLEKAKEN